MYIFVILAHFRIFSDNKTNKENMHLIIVLSHLTQSIQCKNKLNFFLIILIFDENSSSFLHI